MSIEEEVLFSKEAIKPNKPNRKRWTDRLIYAVVPATLAILCLLACISEGKPEVKDSSKEGIIHAFYEEGGAVVEFYKEPCSFSSSEVKKFAEFVNPKDPKPQEVYKYSRFYYFESEYTHGCWAHSKEKERIFFVSSTDGLSPEDLNSEDTFITTKDLEFPKRILVAGSIFKEAKPRLDAKYGDGPLDDGSSQEEKSENVFASKEVSGRGLLYQAQKKQSSVEGPRIAFYENIRHYENNFEGLIFGHYEVRLFPFSACVSLADPATKAMAISKGYNLPDLSAGLAVVTFRIATPGKGEGYSEKTTQIPICYYLNRDENEIDIISQVYGVEKISSSDLYYETKYPHLWGGLDKKK